MIFPKDFEQKTGFSPLRLLLTEECETRLGKEEAGRMRFETNLKIIKDKLGRVKEMVSLLEERKNPEYSVHDILPWLGALKAEGAYLTGERMNKVKTTLISMESLSKFFSTTEENIKTIPKLTEKFSGISVFPEITRLIEKSIDSFGEVKDSASPELNEIRQNIRRAEGSIQKAMQSVLQRSIKEGLIDKDTTPGIRDGRMVIPVPAGNKRSISGIVHDMSATGKTVFIEPGEVVEAGNRLRELKAEEMQEVIRILQNLSSEIRPFIDEIKDSCHLLAEYDFIRAKAKFALMTGGDLPFLSGKPEIEWYHAVHPGLLLTLRKQNKEAVPLDIRLDKEHRILIISGPNAGGKSVCLKTVAVVQYMMQCGLLPTLYYNSHMGTFDDIFIDIGDEQSIENDLSTYSSHLSNMKFFLNHADKESLILADEMGSGTEPQIGGALAQSILKVLGEKGCMGVVTTHYQNLKTFADNEPGFINGAMLYDRQHLAPTFKLSIGHPGSSFALDIARKIGLPSDVVEAAKEIVGSEYVDLDKYLLDIQRDRKYWQNKRLNIKEKEHKLDKLLAEYEETSASLGKQKGIILKAAREEAKEILAGANAMIERSIHEIRKAEAEKEQTKKIRKELEDYKQNLSKEENSDNKIEGLKSLKRKKRKGNKAGNNERDFKSPSTKAQFQIDDYVRLSDGGVIGRIISIEGNKAEVAFGVLRSKVDIKKLIPAKKPKENVKEGAILISSSQDDGSRSRQLNFKNEIDVRGMRADEALQAVTYFLDDAIQFNIGRLRILHGTGHGILKNLIRQQLKANPNVSHFEDEDVRFGGAGITVVEL